MTTTERLTTLLLEDGRSRGLASRSLEPAVGGALLLELLAVGALEFVSSGVLHYRRLVRATTVDPQDPLLRRAARMVAGPAGSGLPAIAAVERLGSALTGAVLERLERRGVVEHRSERVLGWLRTDRWIVVDRSPATGLRQDLRSVLVEGAEPTSADALVLTVLAEVGRPVPLTGLGWGGYRAALAKARRITAEVPGRAAVRSAVLNAADTGNPAMASA